MAQVDRLLNSGMQKPGNRGNEASVDCVLVKMSVKTENQGCREMREGLKPEEGKNRNYLPPTLVRMINAICDILVTARAQWRRDKREPPISGAQDITLIHRKPPGSHCSLLGPVNGCHPKAV